MFRIKLANINPIFIELKRFSSLFVVKFQASILDESHHLLVKLSCKADYENLDGLRSRSAVCFLQPILQLCKKSLSLHYDCVFYIYALLIYANTRSIEAEQQLGFRHWLPKLVYILQNVCA